MATSEEKKLILTKSISKMIWLNKKIIFFHKTHLLNHVDIIPRVLLDENCSSRNTISKLRKNGWKVKLVRFAERGLSDEIIFSLFDDWRPHLFITFDKHFAQYDRFRSHYQGMIGENGHLEKWLPIIYLLPFRLVKKPLETSRHIQERIKRFHFSWEDYKEYHKHVKSFKFGIITIRGERKSHINDHAPFKENIYTDTIEIDLSRKNLTFISLWKFNEFPGLQIINLAENKLKGLDLSPLKDCSNLIEFNLTSNDFSSLDINPLVDCENLELLHIDNGVKLIINEDTLKENLPPFLEKLREEGRLN